jgi:hypothetical protein
MEQALESQTLSMNRQPKEWAKLIRKLRWIGMEDEARQLQTVVSGLPADERGTVSAGPFFTD